MSGVSCFRELVSRLDQIGLGEEYNLYADWSRDEEGLKGARCVSYAGNT